MRSIFAVSSILFLLVLLASGKPCWKTDSCEEPDRPPIVQPVA